jgi:hypothetical protein
MPGRIRSRVNALFLVSFGILTAVVLSALVREPSIAQQPGQPADGQTYVGTRECAACHLDQFMSWKATPHAKAFDVLPAKYRAETTCLKCHTTGHGDPSGFKSQKETPNLVGNSCEGCHGPGSKHAALAKSFAQQKLSPEQQQQVRSTIHRMLPRNVCIDCHSAASHKSHPPYDKK